MNDKLDVFQTMWDSAIYGGSVLEPIVFPEIHFDGPHEELAMVAQNNLAGQITDLNL